MIPHLEKAKKSVQLVGKALIKRKKRSDEILKMIAAKNIVRIFASLGLIYCVLQVVEVPLEFCKTSGCEITEDITFLGISLYLYGAFFFLAVLALVQLDYRRLANILVTVAVLVDIFLLSILAIGSPCFSCAVVAILIALTYLSILYWDNKSYNYKNIIVIGLWLLVFVPNMFNVAQELLISPRPIYGDKNAEVKVFFAPDCPHCKEAIQKLIDNDADFALYPIASSDKEYSQMCAMQCAIDDGENIDSAYKKCITNACSGSKSIYDEITMRVMSSYNKMYLTKIGKKEVPLLLSKDIIRLTDSDDNNSSSSPFSSEGGSEGGSCSL